MRTDSGPLRYGCFLLSAAAIVTVTGCGGDDTTGASAPPRAQALQPSGATGGSPPTGRSGTVGPSTTAPGASAGAIDPAQVALTTISAYFEEINKASLEGRVADVNATAMPGCQTCMLDIGVTRSYHDRGGHTDVGPLDVSMVTVGPRDEKTITARMTVTIRAVRLLDAAGHTRDSYAAQRPRAATATLSLTAAGWRIQNFLYFSGPS